MSGADVSSGVRLSCRPGKSGAMLTFEYRVENHGPGDIYVMDATPSVDPATRLIQANDQAAVVMLGPEDEAIVGKFVAPLPTERRIAMPVVPLAFKLAAGTALDRHLSVPFPLAESSPYFADLPLRQYEMLEIKGVRFTVAYWEVGRRGVAAAPAPYAPHLWSVVVAPDVIASTCMQRFPTTRLQLFKRLDAFPRD